MLKADALQSSATSVMISDENMIEIVFRESVVLLDI